MNGNRLFLDTNIVLYLLAGDTTLAQMITFSPSPVRILIFRVNLIIFLLQFHIQFINIHQRRLYKKDMLYHIDEVIQIYLPCIFKVIRLHFHHINFFMCICEKDAFVRLESYPGSSENCRLFYN